MFEKCFLCGKEDELVEAIGEAEIMRVCRVCADKNRLPIIPKPTAEQLSETNVRIGSGSVPAPAKKTEVDVELEKIVVENVHDGPCDDLVDNYHWHIQHARRMKKISHKQLAELIAEPEIVVSMIEKAKLPKDYQRVVSKLEQFLGIVLFKVRPKVEGEVELDKVNPFEVTTSDLKKMATPDESPHIDISEERDEEVPEVLEDSVEVKEKKDKKGFWKDFFSLDD